MFRTVMANKRENVCLIVSSRVSASYFFVANVSDPHGDTTLMEAPQNISFTWPHMLRMPPSVKSRFRNRPAGGPFTLITGTCTNWG